MRRFLRWAIGLYFLQVVLGVAANVVPLRRVEHDGFEYSAHYGYTGTGNMLPLLGLSWLVIGQPVFVKIRDLSARRAEFRVVCYDLLEDIYRDYPWMR